MTNIFHSRKSIKVLATSLVILAVGISSAPFLLIRLSGNGREVASAVTEGGGSTQEPSVFKEVAKPLYFPPLKISFKEKVLDVEEVGVESDGTLSVPQNWQGAGWYKDGSKAGEEGKVIIDGHYDTTSGAPAAFWQLKDLQVGDRVTLTDRLGRDFEYLVNGKSYISISDPERSKVFASGKEKLLTLITCGGVWDYASGTYNKRLVITAVFDKMEKDW